MPDLVAGFVLMLLTIMSVCSGLILVAVWMGDDRRPPPARSNARSVKSTIRSVLGGGSAPPPVSPMAASGEGSNKSDKAQKQGLRSRK